MELYDNLVNLEISKAPVRRSEFKASCSNPKNFIKWDSQKAVPFIFTSNSQQLDAGYLCQQINKSTYLPVCKLYVDHAAHTVEILPWYPDCISENAENLLLTLQNIVQHKTLTSFELLENLAEEFLSASNLITYLQASDEIQISMVLVAYLQASPSVNTCIPSELDPYLRPYFEKLKNPNISTREKEHVFNYIDTVKTIPFNEIIFSTVSKELLLSSFQSTHYGLENIKHLLTNLFYAYKQNSFFPKAICLVGPPGVGKTTLIKTLVDASGLKQIVIPLGGAKDSAVLTGFASTYSQSAPGRIIKGLISSKCMNPVFILDEIDKAKSEVHDALHHILDPEQQSVFVDNYLGFPISIKQCLYVCTANNLKAIPESLLDRLLVIKLNNYTLEEKLIIVEKFVFPKLMKAFNIHNLHIDPKVYMRLANAFEIREIESKVLCLLAAKVGATSALDLVLSEYDLDVLNASVKTKGSSKPLGFRSSE